MPHIAGCDVGQVVAAGPDTRQCHLGWLLKSPYRVPWEPSHVTKERHMTSPQFYRHGDIWCLPEECEDVDCQIKSPESKYNVTIIKISFSSVTTWNRIQIFPMYYNYQRSRKLWSDLSWLSLLLITAWGLGMYVMFTQSVWYALSTVQYRLNFCNRNNFKENTTAQADMKPGAMTVTRMWNTLALKQEWEYLVRSSKSLCSFTLIRYWCTAACIV